MTTKQPVDLTEAEAAILKAAVRNVWNAIHVDVLAGGGELANDERLEMCVDCERLLTFGNDNGAADALFTRLARVHGYLPMLDALDHLTLLQGD